MRVKKMQFHLEKKNRVKTTKGDTGLISEIKDKTVGSKKRRGFALSKDSTVKKAPTEFVDDSLSSEDDY